MSGIYLRRSFSDLHNQIASVVQASHKMTLYCNAQTKCIWFHGWCFLCQVFLNLCTWILIDHVWQSKHNHFIAFALALSEGCMFLIWMKVTYMADNQDYFLYLYFILEYCLPSWCLVLIPPKWDRGPMGLYFLYQAYRSALYYYLQKWKKHSISSNKR